MAGLIRSALVLIVVEVTYLTAARGEYGASETGSI